MRMKSTVLILLLLGVTLGANAQVDSVKTKCKCPVKLNVGADLMSRYIWRGTDYGSSPSIQPTLSLSIGNFEIGAWGAIAAFSFYKEVDLYAKYSYKNLSVAVTDYYIPSVTGGPASPDIRYFIYDDATTSHTLEGTLQYKRTAKFPFWVLGSAYFYGNDKRWGYDVKKDTTDKTYYSSYFEAGYAFNIKGYGLDLFLGFTPTAGAYGNTLGVVNTGITGYRKIQITDRFELPVKASLVFNPQASAVHFMFGVTL